MNRLQKISVGLLSAIVAVGVVSASFKYSALNWIVDAPGWIVGQFLPTDFHEGEGALGFVLAVFLSWFAVSVAVYGLAFGARKALLRSKGRRTADSN
jgi:hypothetical protein